MRSVLDEDLDDDPFRYAPEELRAQLEELESLMVERARVDPAAFCAYVLRDDSGGIVQNQPMHEEWHRLISENDRVLIWAHVESAKTTSITIGRALFEIGRNPNIRIAILSNTDGQAHLICNTIRRIIESSPEYRRVFPHVVPDKQAGWSGRRLFVQRSSSAKDPTVRSVGVHGNILGARIDYLIVDDILDYENTLSAQQRGNLAAWFKSTIQGRLTKKAKIVVVGTAWHKDDLLHNWAKLRNWLAVRYPVISDDGVLTWPERWPAERIALATEELGPTEANRQLRCLSRSDDDSRFKEEWITRCLARGDGLPVTTALAFVPQGCRVFTGVDLGVKQNKNSDLTVLFTIIVYPDDSREVLEISSGRWKGPDIVKRIFDAHKRFHSIVMVESNAAQQFILDFAHDKKAFPVVPFNTGKNKMNPEFGIESLATELGIGKWIIPSRGGLPANPEILAWVSDMLFYDPSAHTGDRLMASWIAREAARSKVKRGRVGMVHSMSR